jgi:hydrogenase expression/formation protein HypD
MTAARRILDRLHALDLPRPVKVMNVCGGHERTITMAGLRGVLPDSIELVPGPGCPVCVCPEQAVHHAIQIALSGRASVVTFGDMLRVPVNVPRAEPRSLVEARARGADIRPIASPQEAVAIARARPDHPVVFFAAGFETTTAPVAAMLAQGVPDNLSVLLAARRTWPAVAMLLASEQPGFDALIAPGHVATVMGPEEWNFIPAEHGIPTAIGGFTVESLLAALYAVLRQLRDGRPRLENCYPELVRPGGNPAARRQIAATLDVVDANWRGIGSIPASGYAMKPALQAHDATLLFPAPDDADARRRAGQMPPGCDCARVVLGRIYPDQCALFGRACTPRSPVGPCMVSDEGACRVWWAGGIRQPRAEPAPA